MKVFRKVVQGFIMMVVVLGNNAYADTIDFSGLHSGDTGLSSLRVGIGTFDVLGGSVYVFRPGDSGGFTNSGGICALSRNSCQTDWTLTFDYGVTNLIFESDFYNGGDVVSVTAFNGSAAISNSLVVSNGILDFGSAVILPYYSMIPVINPDSDSVISSLTMQRVFLGRQRLD